MRLLFFKESPEVAGCITVSLAFMPPSLPDHRCCLHGGTRNQTHCHTLSHTHTHVHSVISDASLWCWRTLGWTAEGVEISPRFCPGIGSFHTGLGGLRSAGDAGAASEVSASARIVYGGDK